MHGWYVRVGTKAHLDSRGFAQAAIAKALGRSPSVISRELRRNRAEDGNAKMEIELPKGKSIMIAGGIEVDVRFERSLSIH